MADFTQAIDAKQFQGTHALRVHVSAPSPKSSVHTRIVGFGHCEKFAMARAPLPAREARALPGESPDYRPLFSSARISFFNSVPTRCRARYTWPILTPNRSATFCAGHSLRT